MRKYPELIISDDDYQKLSALLAGIELETAELLEEELERATVVPRPELPTNTVAMYSKVEIEDLLNGKRTTVTLVYPHEANIEEGKISILAPVGAALIGLKVGQEMTWPLPNGAEKSFTVRSVR